MRKSNRFCPIPDRHHHYDPRCWRQRGCNRWYRLSARNAGRLVMTAMKITIAARVIARRIRTGSGPAPKTTTDGPPQPDVPLHLQFNLIAFLALPIASKPMFARLTISSKDQTGSMPRASRHNVQNHARRRGDAPHSRDHRQSYNSRRHRARRPQWSPEL